MELPSNLSSSQKGELMDQVKQQIAVSIIKKFIYYDEILEFFLQYMKRSLVEFQPNGTNFYQYFIFCCFLIN